MKVYGYCKAGCKREVTLRSDFEKTAAVMEVEGKAGVVDSLSGRIYTLEQDATYRIATRSSSGWSFSIKVKLELNDGGTTVEADFPLDDIDATNATALTIRIVSVKTVLQEDNSYSTFVNILCGREYELHTVYSVEFADLGTSAWVTKPSLFITPTLEVFVQSVFNLSGMVYRINTEARAVAEKGDELPAVTAADDGKVLGVVNGEWAAVVNNSSGSGIDYDDIFVASITNGVLVVTKK